MGIVGVALEGLKKGLEGDRPLPKKACSAFVPKNGCSERRLLVCDCWWESEVFMEDDPDELWALREGDRKTGTARGFFGYLISPHPCTKLLASNDCSVVGALPASFPLGWNVPLPSTSFHQNVSAPSLW